jgi:hypothetical protein
MDEKIIIGQVCQKIKNRFSFFEDVKTELLMIENRGRPIWICGESPLEAAVNYNRKELIRMMVNDCGFDIDSESGYIKRSALQSAISKKNEYLVRFLVLEMKATVNINYPPNYSPLCRAISLDDTPMVRLLIEELGADVNFRIFCITKEGTPFLALHHAMRHDYA